jgi:anti-sigma factor RsiW
VRRLFIGLRHGRTPVDLPCQEVVELLDHYLEGGLDPAMRAALEAHLAGCDGCSTYLEQLKAAIELARQTGERTLPPSLEQELIKAFGSHYPS